MAKPWSNKTSCTYWPAPQLVGRMYIKSGTTYVLSTTQYDPPSGPQPWLEAQSTWSAGHRGPPYKSGGPFSSIRLSDMGHLVQGNHTLYSRAPTYLYKYVGGFTCGSNLHQYLGFSCTPQTLDGSYGRGDPEPYGATGWGRYRPDQRLASLGQAIAEAKDIPRMLKTTARGFRDLWRSQRRILKPKELSNHWLNHHFGWLPFLSDLRDAIDAYRKFDSLLAEARRNNGKTVRRGGTVKVEESVELLSESAVQTRHSPSLNVYFYPNAQTSQQGSYKITRSDFKRVWFEGAFRYYVPDIDSVQFERRFLRGLYGLTLNPELVWELTPWSWLIDWFGNIGDVIGNVSDSWADNLAAAYAYVMENRRTSVSCASTLRTWDNFISNTWTFEWESKGRAQASPYGFGTTWDDFSPKQLSILAALGIMRT